jgi:hypothetical protein
LTRYLFGVVALITAVVPFAACSSTTIPLEYAQLIPEGLRSDDQAVARHATYPSSQ